MENLINFIINGYGYGYGDGNGNCYADGYGNGDSCGYGYNYGYGYGDGNGDGNGNGDSCGYGDGNGDGNGYGIKKINGMHVVKIDGIPTAIKKIKGNIAFGYVFEKMQLKPCYVVKQDGLFAHGKTVKEAFSALQEKLFDNMTVDERINAFLQEIKINTEYPAKIFYDWHHRLTGSCEFGRNEFIERHNISLDEMMTVKRFIELTENNYGGEVIRRLKERIN